MQLSFLSALGCLAKYPISFAHSDPFQMGACSRRKTQPKKQCLEAFLPDYVPVMSLHSSPSPFKDDTFLLSREYERSALLA